MEIPAVAYPHKAVVITSTVKMQGTGCCSYFVTTVLKEVSKQHDHQGSSMANWQGGRVVEDSPMSHLNSHMDFGYTTVAYI